MGQDRKFKDILAHIVLALTGIGFFIIAGKKLVTGSGFLNRTKRQTLLDNVKEANEAAKPQGNSPRNK